MTATAATLPLRAGYDPPFKIMLLYIHVPFCSKKCAYCAFYSVPLATGPTGGDILKGYLAVVLAELAAWGERLGRTRVETVFFGGGTPSLLPAGLLARLLEAVGKTFMLATDAEITAEANPESALADGWLFEARQAGINRLSLGVQSFCDTDLARLGRAHDARTAEAAFTTARAAGFTNISLDLMWGLPGAPGRPRSQSHWLLQLKRAGELKPEHISAYGLTVEEGSPLEQSCAREECSLPGEKDLASMYLAGAEFLEGQGYMQYEISNYARMGFECRHNTGYWQGADYLGLGPAATSTLHGRRWTNPADPRLWRERVREQCMDDGAETLGKQTRLKELLMLRLRTSKGLALKEYQTLGGRAFSHDFKELAGVLCKNGLAATRDGRFRLTRSGMLVSDAILAHFFAALERNAG